MPSLHRQPQVRLRSCGRAGKRLITEFCAVVLFFASRGRITVRLHNARNLGGRFNINRGVVAGVMEDALKKNISGMDAGNIFFLSANSYGCWLLPPF